MIYDIENTYLRRAAIIVTVPVYLVLLSVAAVIDTLRDTSVRSDIADSWRKR